ncbi:MAG: J domain-containing protein [Cyanobacteria bacterium SZAS TMP-1]|nr:J domain-containing protein [Cyanobacteria bacterium SZAS TMP-1]
MIDAETLADAYFVLSLKPGDQMDKVNARWKRLAMVWHPDRFPSEHGKKDAEEELKKINDAKDKLNKHFASEHKATGPCACNPTGAKPKQQERSGTGQGPGPGKRRTTQENSYEETEARRRNEERAKRNAEQDAEKAKQAAAAAEAAKAQAAVKTAVDQSRQIDDERLRWKISIGIIVAWVALNFFGFASMSAKGWWKDFSWKWERDHAPTPPAQTNLQTSTPDYIPPYNKFPGGDQGSWQQQEEQDQKRRDEQAESQKKQDIYNTRMTIDRYQKTIAHCNLEIAKVDAQLADPAVSDYEKRKSSSFADAQRGYLAEAQSNLAEAQKRFTELTGRPASEANTTDWSPTASPTITPSNHSLSVPINDMNFTNPAPPPVVAPSNLFLTPSTTTPSSQPWKPNYLQNQTGVAPFNPLGSSPSVSPYLDKTNPIFKQRMPNLFDKTARQNP